MTEPSARMVRFDHYGGRDVLYVAEVAMPVPASHEVVVAVKAAGINPGEAAIRSGALDARFPATFPSGQGSDLAGVVVARGDGVTEFEIGDEVLGFSWSRSSHASHVSVPTSQLIAKPAALSWEVAGSLYVVGCTAYAAVRAVDPTAKDTVAVSAAAGGVGTVVVQLLVQRGARVLAIASAHNSEWLHSHGAVPVAYGAGLRERLVEASGHGIDAFIDLFGPEYVQLGVDLGVAPERIETITAFEIAQELGVKTDGSARRRRPRCSPRWPTWRPMA